MTPAEHTQLVLNAVESGLDTEIEIAELLFDLAPASAIQKVIEALLVQQTLVRTESGIEFPTASIADPAAALASIGSARTSASR